MVNDILTGLKTALRDRMFMTLAIVLLVLTVMVCIYIGVVVHPSSVQLAVRYTAFGATTYYREQWYYLILFIVFLIGGFILNTAIGARLQNAGRGPLARGWMMLVIGLVIMTFIIAHSVLGIAYL